MALAADDATDRVEQLVTLTERLTELLTNETRAYEERRPLDAAATAQETARLANVYRHETARVKKDRALVEGAPEPLRRRLVEATQTFEAVLARHVRAVEAALTITEGVIRAVAEEIAASRENSAGYGRRGEAARPSAAPLALNRKA